MLDNLGSDLLDSVDDGRAGVIGKLRADYECGIPILLREIEADAAPRADFGYAPVRVDVVGSQVNIVLLLLAAAPSLCEIAAYHL